MDTGQCGCRGGLGPKGGPQPHYETTLLGAEGAEIFGKNSGFLVKNGTFLYFFNDFYQFSVKITPITIKNSKLTDFYPILEKFSEISDFFRKKIDFLTLNETTLPKIVGQKCNKKVIFGV